MAVIITVRPCGGKVHSIALVLSGLVLAICCERDGNLSSLHRHMVNQFSPLCHLTQQEDQRLISRAQLPLLLAKVNGVLLAKLLFEWFGLLLTPEQKAGLPWTEKTCVGAFRRVKPVVKPAFWCSTISLNKSLGKPITAAIKTVRNWLYVNYQKMKTY